MPNKENEYSKLLISDFYSVCPKAVFAAMAVSLMVNHCSHSFDAVTRALLQEWYILHMQGIVPQCPPNKLWDMIPVTDKDQADVRDIVRDML